MIVFMILFDKKKSQLNSQQIDKIYVIAEDNFTENCPQFKF